MSEPEPGSTRGKQGSTVIAPAAKEEIRKHVQELLSDDFAVRAASLTTLEKYGAVAAEAIVDELVRKPEPNALTSFSDALVEIGKPSINVVLHAFGHLPHIRWPEHVYLVENLVDLLAQLRDRRAVTPLLEQLAKLNAAIKRHHNPQLVHCCEAAKVKIHRALIEFGDKRGLEDLTEMLGDGRKRVRDGVVEAIARIGDRRALVPLVRLYDIDDHGTLIKQAIREIVRRERVTSEDRLFKDLNPSERVTLGRVFPKPRSGKH